ncbi:hypothetical protein BMG00_13025 [Thioclava marina]|uniref:Glycosyltransferase 2-like domain-containing protein n=1 Tax=Thioclava marina TaxID=1915077 RepID=A0ABX3MPI4_9RHOB|nr:glycosyltransferase [Thioclava marina]OOY11988.1 hypothetical protein BMG00_13025 [Thioclava marina]
MKITVITAVYNSQATVGEAIESVGRQPHPELEHLIIEGKSTDGSLAAIERASHDRMFLASERDKGIYDALNKGVAKASGDVLGFVHSDDFLAHDDVLSRIAAAFEDPRVKAVFSNLDYVSQATGRSVYIPEVLYKMRLGGVSNRNLARIREKMGEDWRAIRRNKVGCVMTLASKNLSKLGQFFERQKS